jgi:hypothetical protein
MWRLAAPSLAFVLLGASFLRAGSMPLVAACAVLLAMLAVPRWWAARIAQLALLLAALRWVWLTWTLAAMRAAAGVPATRMGVILGSVAMLTLLSALVFRARPLQRYYGLYRERGGRADE